MSLPIFVSYFVWVFLFRGILHFQCWVFCHHEMFRVYREVKIKKVKISTKINVSCAEYHLCISISVLDKELFLGFPSKRYNVQFKTKEYQKSLKKLRKLKSFHILTYVAWNPFYIPCYSTSRWNGQWLLDMCCFLWTTSYDASLLQSYYS